jgi:CRISPR-associated protein Csd1
MILQALCEYYQRKQKDPDDTLAPFGFEEKGIPFVIVINQDGHFIQFEDTRTLGGKKPLPRQFMLAKGVKKTSGVLANVLWDPADYVLGVDKKGKPERTQEQKSCFIRTIRETFSTIPDNPAIAAVLKFYELPEQPLSVDPLWPVIEDTNPLLTFRLAEDGACIVFNRPEVVAAYQQCLGQRDGEQIRCLVSGKKTALAVTHPAIKGVWGAQSSGANIVSFNQESFCSWGKWKQQGANSPIGEQAAFEYTTALNHLLRTNSPNRLQMGETSVICWAAKCAELETLLPLIFGDVSKDNPDENIRAVQVLFASLYNGTYQAPDGDERFYLLGLAPNAARISVRFWQAGTVASFSECLGQWFTDLAVVGARHGGVMPLKPLLRSVAALGKDENLSPQLAGEVVRAILSGRPLPNALFTALLVRLKAEKGQVNDHRAALIKAWLNRQFRVNHRKEVTVSLNLQESRIGYLLGRLFAVLEKLQADANPGLNATIRDRYYSSASCTPKAVFGTLLRLHTHHLKKLDNPAFRTVVEKRIQSIMTDIADFPAHLSLEEQGLFAIGYYHQRQDLFAKKETNQGEKA